MTRKLEEELGLPHLSDIEEESDEEFEPEDITEYENNAQVMINSLSTSEKLDRSLSEVTGLDRHDTEMDDITRRALKSYDELVDLGKNAPPAHSGKMYEVASQMLRAALDARDSKVNRKLKLLDLQLKKLKLDQQEQEHDGPQGQILDRNSLLAFLKEGSGTDDTDK